jgi:hypothetical protein
MDCNEHLFLAIKVQNFFLTLDNKKLIINFTLKRGCGRPLRPSVFPTDSFCVSFTVASGLAVARFKERKFSISTRQKTKGGLENGNGYFERDGKSSARN